MSCPGETSSLHNSDDDDELPETSATARARPRRTEKTALARTKKALGTTGTNKATTIEPETTDDAEVRLDQQKALLRDYLLQCSDAERVEALALAAARRDALAKHKRRVSHVSMHRLAPTISCTATAVSVTQRDKTPNTKNNFLEQKNKRFLLLAHAPAHAPNNTHTC